MKIMTSVDSPGKIAAPQRRLWDDKTRHPVIEVTGFLCSVDTRFPVAYLHLRSPRYEDVRMAPGNYDTMVNQLLPGRLRDVTDNRKPEHGRGSL